MRNRTTFQLMILTLTLTSACATVPRSDAGGLTGAARIPVTEFLAGDCFDDPESVEVEDVAGLPCDVPHDNEVYAIFDHEGTDQSWPGVDALNEYSYLSCVDRFTDYVGSDYIDSRLEVSFLSPLEAGWIEGDREIVCFVFDLDLAKLTESMRDSEE